MSTANTVAITESVPKEVLLFTFWPPTIAAGNRYLDRLA